MTEERLNQRLAQIFTHEELLCVDAYFSRKYGLCVDLYLDGFPEDRRLSRFVKNVKNVAMGNATIRILKSNDYR